MAQYGKTAYWDERYTKDPEPFDWYQRYSGIKDLIAQYVKKSDNILMAGCGNSRLSEDMYDDGERNKALTFCKVHPLNICLCCRVHNRCECRYLQSSD